MVREHFFLTNHAPRHRIVVGRGSRAGGVGFGDPRPCAAYYYVVVLLLLARELPGVDDRSQGHDVCSRAFELSLERDESLSNC
jgi:hypothetical protein